jgi:hypothetical protein
MARGIISTILGGVAGGLEGREKQYLRTREEEERRLAREAEAAQREFMNKATLTQMGATPGARLREDFAGQARSRMDQRDGALSRALDSTPAAPPQAAGSATGRGLESAVGRAFETAEIAPQRERFVPQVQDPDYFEMQTPGGQLFSMETPEARRDRERAQFEADREEERAYEDLLRREDRDWRRELADLQQQTQINLAGLNYRNQLDLLDARMDAERSAALDPEIRFQRGRDILSAVIGRLDQSDYGFDPESSSEMIEGIAELLAPMYGTTGDELLYGPLQPRREPAATPFFQQPQLFQQPQQRAIGLDRGGER